MTFKTMIIAAVSASALFVGGTAFAAPVVFCTNGGIDLVNDGCISGESKAYSPSWDGVYSNAGGGDPEGDVEAAILAATGTAVDISLYGKTDDNPSLFSTTGLPGQSGTWSTVSGALIKYITVKAANSFALYDVQNTSSGNWTTAGILNNGGQQPGVSHISFWTAGSVPTVPLPAAGWMLLAGVGGLFAAKRRKKA